MGDVILTEEQARGRCAYWQKVLCLQDWQVEVSVVREKQMSVEGLAECHWQIKKRWAVVNLRDYVDFDPDWFGSRDMELSLVHELLHMHAAAFDDYEVDTPKEVALEQAIHAISTALVELERRGGK